MTGSKTRQKRVAISAISVILVLSLLAGITLAWFTDRERANANFFAGTLDLSMRPDGPESPTGALEFQNLRPLTLEQFTAELQASAEKVVTNKTTEGFDPLPAYFHPVTLKNEGSLPMQAVLSVADAGAGEHTIKNLVSNGKGGVTQDGMIACAEAYTLKNVLKVVLFENKGNAANPDWQLVKNADGSLVDLMEQTYEPYDAAHALGAGESEQFVIGGWLPESVGNTYQAKHFHANIVAQAGQADAGAEIGKDEPSTVRPSGWTEPTTEPTEPTSPTEPSTEPTQPTEPSTEPTDPPAPVEKDIPVTVVFTENGVEVGRTTFTFANITADINKLLTQAMVSVPTGYTYDPIEQSHTIQLDYETGSAKPGTVEFTVRELAPVVDREVTVQWLDIDAENAVVGSYKQGVTAKVGEQDTVYPDSSKLPGGYELAVTDPAQSARVTITEDGVTPDPVGFLVKKTQTGPVDPDNPDCDRDDHIIRTAEDLNNVREHPHCNFIVANDIDLSGAYPSWTPIGELNRINDPWNGTSYEPSENVFTGDLNGDGHKITGLNVSALQSFNGLFRYSSGTIRDLAVDGTVNAHSNSGILVGWNAGKVEGCTISGSIKAGSQTANIWEVGGIVGWNDTAGVISGCASLADVTGNPAYGAAHYYYGGISGSNNGTVINCYSSGTVRGSRAGGLLGYNSGTISRCYTTAKVYALIDTYGNVDTWTHPTVGELGGGSVDVNSIFFQKGNLYRNNQVYTGWDTDKYRGLGKTAEEMKAASTYLDAGWDNTVWEITEGSLPRLK